MVKVLIVTPRPSEGHLAPYEEKGTTCYMSIILQTKIKHIQGTSEWAFPCASVLGAELHNGSASRWNRKSCHVVDKIFHFCPFKESDTIWTVCDREKKGSSLAVLVNSQLPRLQSIFSQGTVPNFSAALIWQAGMDLSRLVSRSG